MYALRHKKTGQLMPQLRQHGYSFWNGKWEESVGNPNGYPRVFKTKKSLLAAMKAWSKGEWHFEKYKNNNPLNNGLYIFSVVQTSQSNNNIQDKGRKMDDLEIVKINIECEPIDLQDFLQLPGD